MEGVETSLSSHAEDVFDTGIQKSLFPDTTSASIPAVPTLRNSLSMHVFFAYSNIFSHCSFC
jgi:hypothetical protein